jgi:hypothetical protein
MFEWISHLPCAIAHGGRDVEQPEHVKFYLGVALFEFGLVGTESPSFNLDFLKKLASDKLG